MSRPPIDVKLPVSREKDSNRASVGLRHVRTGRPTAAAAARNIDHSSHTDSAMDAAEIRKTASLCKSEFVNKALAGSHALAAVRVIRRTELPIGCAGRGIAAGDTMAARGPGPPHGVAHRDVDRVRYKHIAALPHRDIDNRAGSRWHTARSWLAVLIKNAESRSSVLLLWYHTRALVARFSSHQKYDCKHDCQPKNRPYCV